LLPLFLTDRRPSFRSSDPRLLVAARDPFPSGGASTPSCRSKPGTGPAPKVTATTKKLAQTTRDALFLQLHKTTRLRRADCPALPLLPLALLVGITTCYFVLPILGLSTTRTHSLTHTHYHTHTHVELAPDFTHAVEAFLSRLFHSLSFQHS
jgi:hypothetical protein